MHKTYIRILLFRLISFMIWMMTSCRSSGSPIITYELSFPNKTHHEVQIKLTVSRLPGKPLHLLISRGSPGRYALHQFSRNIYSIQALDSKENPLNILQPSTNEWVINKHDGSVVFQYTAYGNILDGTHSSITDDYILLNIPSILVWLQKWQSLPVQIKINNPNQEWQIFTQLQKTQDQDVFQAKDLHYLMDSPIFMGKFSVREWEVLSNNRKTLFRLVVNHLGNEAEIDDFSNLIKPVIDEQIVLFGGLPEFDDNQFTFMCSYLPHAEADGMEHRNSTVITRHNDLRPYIRKFLMTISHEFFHSWVVERLRPASITPFDFSDANICEELWFAEGAVEYYDDLFLTRSGIKDPSVFAYGLQFHLNSILQSRVYLYQSAVDISKRASIVDGSFLEDVVNDNYYFSHYHIGDIICLGLDLTLRTKFPSLDMDIYMKKLWKKYGEKEIAFTNQDLELTLAEITQDPEFARQFFNQYIYGNQIMDYKSLLSHAGFLLRQKRQNRASLGAVNVWSNYGTVTVKSTPAITSPLYQAGIGKNDAIIAINNRKTTSRSVFYNILNRYRPGQNATIIYRQAGRVKTSTVLFSEDDEMEVVLYEYAGLKVTDEQLKFRTDWLGSKVQ